MADEVILKPTKSDIESPVGDLLERYEILSPLNHKEDAFLVMNRETKEICVEKITFVYQRSLYDWMLEHPMEGVPKIYEIGETDGKLIIIEEYIHGLNLQQILQQKGLFSENDVAGYMITLCDILKSFHDMRPRIIHRDIKPENIILSNHGGIYLIDFNVSREYKPENDIDTAMIVSHHFSAPELYGFGQSNVRSDIYSIGATMHYLLTGHFVKESSYYGPLGNIIEKCTMMEANARYQSVDELKKKLKHFLFFHKRKAGSLAISREEERRDSVYKKKVTKKGKTGILQKLDSYLLPGFRTKKIWKMIVAILFYALWTCICYEMKIESTVNNPLAVIDVFVEKILVWAFGFITVFLIFDYRGCQRYLPFEKAIKIKWIRIFLALFLIVGAMLLLMIMNVCFLDLFS